MDERDERDGFEVAQEDDELAGDDLLDDEESADEPDDDEPDDDDFEFDDEAGDEPGDEDETEFATIAAGPTVEEAKRRALVQLRKLVPSVAESDVEFVVVEEGARGGFFGRGKAEARVEARVLPGERRPDDEAERTDNSETLREFVQTVVDLMGIEAAVDADETTEAVRANISGDDLGLLIGRHGATIDALQYVAAIVVNGARRDRRQVIVDAEGYRERRETALQSLADRTAQKVTRESASIALKPMSAAERKVVHLHLKDHPRVETASEGNEPFRAVVVSPRGQRD